MTSPSPSMLDQLQQVGETVQHLLEMDDSSLQTALMQGFEHHAPPYQANRTSAQWAASLLDWMTSMVPLLKSRIDIPAESERIVIAIRNAEESVVIGPECEPPQE